MAAGSAELAQDVIASARDEAEQQAREYLSEAPAAYTPVVPLAAQNASVVQEGVESLRKEPSTDEECAAGFQLFATYLDKVTEIRVSTLALWEASKEFFVQGTDGGVVAAIKAIDEAGNMGVDDPPKGEWIVHSMAQRANKNHAVISSVVHSIETSLSLLKREDVDCPMCLETLSDGRPSKVLACCHKTCAECWANFSVVCAERGIAPFCPLCRGPAAFIEAITPVGRRGL
jgi:hypothetical protein